MILSDDGSLSEILVQGDDVQVEQMRKELKFSEKGMIYVKGIFETWLQASFDQGFNVNCEDQEKSYGQICTLA